MTPPHTRPVWSPERWRHIQSVLADAMTWEVPARPARLEEVCRGDEVLRLEVESLLEAHDATGLFDSLNEDMAPASSWARACARGLEGRRVAQYRVENALGAGGMGVVYKARDERLDRFVALKFLPAYISAQPEAKARFLAEARAAAALDHPNVCTIHEIGESEGELFIAMPLYDGETLQGRIERGALPFDDAVAIAMQIARGLDRAHDRGVVHLDVKPSNVMLLRDGGVKLLDFGVARVVDGSRGGSGVAMGTLAYMSPEHVGGSPVDARSDLWALGVLLYEMLAGTRPFRGESVRALAAEIATRNPVPLSAACPGAHPGIDDVLRKALAKPVEERYATAAAMIAGLAALIVPAGGATADSRAPLTDPVHRATGGSREPVGERRRLTALVTIVSDYAALVERLPQGEADLLLARVHDAADAVARLHGGVVNQSLGEEIVMLFGVPTAHEDDHVRAVRAAIDLHRRAADLSFAADAHVAGSVRLQSGLHLGPAVTHPAPRGPRRFTVVGTPAQTAAALASAAGRGQVLLSAEFQRLVSPFVQTEPAPPVTIPGAERIVPYRVTGETGFETRLDASAHAGLTPYIGRHGELALLESQMTRTRASKGCLVTVVGEPGSGKSRLLRELRQRLTGADDALVLQGRCRAHDGLATRSPFVEILRQALDLRPGVPVHAEEVGDRLRAIDAALERYTPLYLHMLSASREDCPLPRHLQGERLQVARLEAFSSLIEAQTALGPVVMLIEDWHDADSSSRDMLQRLAELAPARRLLIAVTTRPESASDDLHPRGTRIHLGPLDFTSALGIMHSVLRVSSLPEELALLVHERAGGNPFFLEEVCCALLEQGAVNASDGEAVLSRRLDAMSLPDTVQAVIRTRLDNLEPRSQDVLRVAAVIGRDFERGLLADVVSPDVALDRAIEALTASGLIQQVSPSPPAYRFKHVLTQEVSYDSLLGHQRRSWHRAIARVLEQRPVESMEDRAGVLAYHFGRAESWAEAVRYGKRAAEGACTRSQFADALAMLDAVQGWLSELPDGDAGRDGRAELLLMQERLCETLGLRSRQQQIIGDLIAHLAPHGPSGRLAEAYLRQGDLLTLLKRFHAADGALLTALRLGRERGDGPLERHALRSIGLLRWHEGRNGEALAMAQSAVAIDRESGDELAVAGDLANLGTILRSLGEPEQALACFEEALAMPALLQDPSKLVYTLHMVANVHRSAGNPDAALAYHRQADEIAEKNLLPIQRSFHLTSIAHIQLQQGQVDASLETYREAIELSRRARHADGLVQSLRTLGEVLEGLGRHEDALPCLQEAAHLFAQLENREAEADMWCRVAAVLERRRPSEAMGAWTRVKALRQETSDSRGLLDALEGLARATRGLAGPPEAAIDAFEAALELASSLGEHRRETVLRNTLGILEWTRGRFQSALEHYEAALILARRDGDRTQQGVLLNSLGVTLARLARSDEARTALEESLVLNRAAGDRRLEAHALGALAQVALKVGHLAHALEFAEASRALRQADGDREGEGWMLCRIAEIQEALGNHAEARRARDLAAAIATDCKDAALAAACVPHASA